MTAGTGGTGLAASRLRLRRNDRRRFGACMLMVAKSLASGKAKTQSKCNLLCIKLRIFHMLFFGYPQAFPQSGK
jgi:hypothetical protein